MVPVGCVKSEQFIDNSCHRKKLSAPWMVTYCSLISMDEFGKCETSVKLQAGPFSYSNGRNLNTGRV